MFNTCMNTTLRICMVALFFCCTIPEKTYASHAAGGEIAYKWLSGDTYLISFKFYRDCRGIGEPDTVNLCIYDSCSGTSFSRTLRKVDTLADGRQNGAQVAIGCAGYKNSCDTNFTQLPGYREWWYQDTVTLNNKCHNWRFSITINARNPSQNIINTAALYLEATLNNKDFPHNNSTVFSTKPVPYVCFRQPFTFNNGSVDPDNDSLVYEAIVPLYTSGGALPPYNCNFNTFPLTFRSSIPALKLPDNPFQTNNTYKLNSETGSITYIAGELGPQTTAIRVKEYRNNILVGSTIRDIQVQVTTCSIQPAELSIDSTQLYGAVYNDGVVELCAGDSMSFCYNVRSSDTGSILILTDNKSLSVPQSNITYYNNRTDSVSACFSWQTSIADSGLKSLTINAKDSTCRPPGVSITQVFTLPIRVKPIPQPPLVTSPIELCHYNPDVPPLTANGINMRWYRTSFGGVGSSTPITPDVTVIGKRFYFVSHLPRGCESERAKIEINVVPPPDINVLAIKDSVCIFEEVGLIDSGGSKVVSSGYSWFVDSGIITTQLPDKKITAYWESHGSKKVILNIDDSVCSIYDTVDVFVVRPSDPHFEIQQDVCIGEPAILSVEPREGTYKWVIDEQTINDNTPIPEYRLIWDSIGLKQLSLSVTDRFGCSDTLTDTIEVHSLPVAEIMMPEQRICLGEQYTIAAIDSISYRYLWGPEKLIADNGRSDALAIGAQGNIYVEVTNEWNCRSHDSVLIAPESCCSVILPDAFTPNGDGKNDMFQPLNSIGYQITNFRIVNRYGEVVYKSVDRESGWNGNYKGNPADVGNYHYFIKYRCNSGVLGEKKGSLILLR